MPCLRREDGRVGLQQVSALHAGAARTGAHEQGVVGVLNAVIGSEALPVPASSGNAQSSSSIMTPLSAFCGPGPALPAVWDDGLVPQHFAGGDAEQRGVTNLASGSGDGYTNRAFMFDPFRGGTAPRNPLSPSLLYKTTTNASQPDTELSILAQLA